MDIIDIRPEFFLKQIREHGDIKIAMEKAGLSEPEMDDLLLDHPKFSRTVVECICEYHEDNILTQCASAKKTIKDFCDRINKTLDDTSAAAIKEIRDGLSG